MIVFNTYSILIVAIFILLLIQRFNAKPGSQQQTNIEKQRDICRQNIESVFEGEDLYQHALIAFEHFQLIQVMGHPEENYCVYLIPGKEEADDKDDIFGYYLSFNDYLLSGSVKHILGFCNQYKKLLDEPEICEKKLSEYFSTSRLLALKEAFYNYRLGKLPTQFLKMIPKRYLTNEHLELIETIETKYYSRSPDDESFINLPLAYYSSIKSGFGLNLNENDGMPNPRVFCERKYNTRINA